MAGRKRDEKRRFGGRHPERRNSRTGYSRGTHPAGRRSGRKKTALGALWVLCLLTIAAVGIWGSSIIKEVFFTEPVIVKMDGEGEPAGQDGGLEGAAGIAGIAELFDRERGSSRSETRSGAEDDQETGTQEALNVDLENLYSPYAILTDADTGEVLAEHRSRERIYPASLTKMMTALLAVENTADLSVAVTLPGDIFPELYAQDASMAGFLPEETVSARDLLYGILLPSGAECSVTFAIRIAGSEAAFVEQMNARAQELGMQNTHFCNCTGLHDADHYTTVEDLALLLRYALQKEEFRSAFTAKRYTSTPSGQHPGGITFQSTMFQYMESTRVAGGEILGGKTGYTDEAGQCLASLAEVNGKEYILVTAKAPGTHQTEQFHILDAQAVYSQIAPLASLTSKLAG